jgi:hypothetical protein
VPTNEYKALGTTGSQAGFFFHPGAFDSIRSAESTMKCLEVYRNGRAASIVQHMDNTTPLFFKPGAVFDRRLRSFPQQPNHRYLHLN